MPPKALLPKPSDLNQLPLPIAEKILGMVDTTNRREHIYAMTALISGATCFLGCLLAFVYLVVQGYQKSAGAVLGATVLSIVGKFIAARQNR
ncbi:hypothetical protein [Terriglobus roseus]|uniref:Uncharacterized protein n=1 Tax=Terriglobus roseus TaxID=392734 RepID=A0A1G7G6D1_9BACT|nr:hypothetical protein [Terriglobus roseus]SDE83663.1 hypothetical protein SAMN05444167_0572 [Terriglobus roseus]